MPSGKSALHWAAAVNNVEATMVLLKNGANKDMQDNKVRRLELRWWCETQQGHGGLKSTSHTVGKSHRFSVISDRKIKEEFKR